MVDMPKLPHKGYVIYSPSLELYSPGGTPEVSNKIIWSKKPKIWSSRGNVANHIALHICTEYKKTGIPYLYDHEYYVYVASIYKDNIDAQIVEIGENKVETTVYNEIERLISNRKKEDEKRRKKIIKSYEEKLKNLTKEV